MPAPAILCDIGNVIVSFDFTIASSRLAALSETAEDRLLDELQRLKIPFEDGQIDDDTFVREAMSAIGFQGSSEEFRHIWCDIFTANAPMVSALSQLATRYPLFLLSNTSGLHKDHLFASFPVFSLVRDGVYSHTARASKPGRRIFEIAIDQLGLDPARTLFIDDLEPNIQTAVAMGFVTHHYDLHQHAHFEAALAQWERQH